MRELLRRLAPWLGLTALLLLLSAGPGTRAGLWQFRTGFQLMRWAVYLGLAGAALGLLALFWRRTGTSPWPALVTVLAGLTAAGVPWSWMRQARSVPSIHDISTDTERPPEFVAILPLRRDAPNSAEYGGPDIAAAQHQAYPDLVPKQLAMPAGQAFARGLTAARAMGWEIVAADSAAGRIEATATTAWFGFKDDVVVRITPEGAGSRMDVRSVSRVGKSDVGTNAKRIREFLRRVETVQ